MLFQGVLPLHFGPNRQTTVVEVIIALSGILYLFISTDGLWCVLAGGGKAGLITTKKKSCAAWVRSLVASSSSLLPHLTEFIRK
jgi:hypothetical protein